MILVDANILLYAYNSSSVRHGAAKAWWEERLSSPEPVLLNWWTLQAFLRLATHPRVFPRPYSPAEAAGIVSAWLARPMVSIAAPSPRFWSVAAPLLQDANARGNLVNDAMLAALALEQGVPIATTDQDFRRFGAVTLSNPLAS